MSGSKVSYGIDGQTISTEVDGVSVTRNLGSPTVSDGIDGASDTANILKKAPFDTTGYWVWSEGGLEWILWGDGDEIEL